MSRENPKYHRWIPEEDKILCENYVIGKREDILELLPRHPNWSSITVRAAYIGVKRNVYCYSHLVPLVERFHQSYVCSLTHKYNETSCWEWIKRKNWGGYGIIHYYSKRKLAHRVAYLLFKGEIPKKYQLHHLCNNRACVNPDHIIAISHPYHRKLHRKKFCKRGHRITTYQSGRRGCRQCHLISQHKIRGFQGNLLPKFRTFCPQKHPYNEKNTYIDNIGNRHCIICMRIRGRVKTLTKNLIKAINAHQITDIEVQMVEFYRGKLYNLMGCQDLNPYFKE